MSKKKDSALAIVRALADKDGNNHIWDCSLAGFGTSNKCDCLVKRARRYLKSRRKP